METITREFQVFTFNELGEEIKSKVRNKWRENHLDYEWYDFIYEDAKTVGVLMGIEIDKIYFSGFHSQGDGACFEGSYSYVENSPKAVEDYAPKDYELQRIAHQLAEIQEENENAIIASIKHSGHYYHSRCTNIEVKDNSHDYGDCKEGVENAITKLLRNFMDWIYARLRKEYNFQMSDEQIDENIRLNEANFLENGEIFN